MSRREGSPEPAGDGGDGGPEVALSARGRFVLACLGAHDGQLTLAELARLLAARTQQCHPRRVPVAAIRQQYVELDDSTLPSLSRRGLVEYCDQDGTVRSCLHQGRP